MNQKTFPEPKLNQTTTNNKQRNNKIEVLRSLRKGDTTKRVWED